MWDKLFGYVGLPVLLDVMGKVGVTDMGKAAIDRVKELGEAAYHKHQRQASIWLVDPLRSFHKIAVVIHFLVALIAALMAAFSGGSEWKFAWLSGMIVAPVIHYWLYRRLPESPRFQVEDGETVRYPDKIGDTDVDHPFAGQPVFADDYELQDEKVSLPLAIGWTIVAGFITSIPLLMLTAFTRNIGFIFLSLMVAGFSIFSMNIVVKLFNWALVRGARLAERGLGFVFMQLAILLPHVTSKDVSADVADDLIPEQDFLPWYIRNRNFLFDTYLLFVLGLLVFPSPEMFQWVAVALTVVGITAHFMSRFGLGDEVLDQRRKFFRTLFKTVGPMVIIQGLLRIFRPELAAKITGMFSNLLAGIVHALGFMMSPCDRIVDQGPKRMILVAIVFGFFAMKVFGFWNKAEGKFIRIASMIGLVSVSYVALLSAYGTLIHYQPQFNMCSAPKVEQTQTPTASLPATVAETPLVKEEGDKKEEKKEEVTEAQRLAIDTISGQQEIAMAAVDDIGKYLHNLIASDDIPTKLGVLIQVKQRLKTLETELKVMKDSSRAMSPEGLESLDQVQKQIAKDNDRLQAVKVTIVDGHLAQIPEKENKTLAGIRDRLGSMMAKLRAAPMLNPASEEESKLAEQRRVAAETAIKLADLRKQKADKEAEEKAATAAADATVTASTASTTAKKSGTCVNCTPEFAALKAELGI